MEMKFSLHVTSRSSIREFPNSLRHPKVHFHVSKNPTLVSILSPRNPIHTTPSNLSNIYVLCPTYQTVYWHSFLLAEGIYQKDLRSRSPYVTFSNRITFTTRSSQPYAQSASWRTTSYQLSITAYSTYLQMSSTSRGLHLHPKPENAPCRGEKRPI